MSLILRKDFKSAIGIVESNLMSGDAAHFGSEATQQQYLNFLFDGAQILSFFD